MPAPAPRHLSLRPGVRVVRRDDRHLQIGLDPPRRVILPIEPGVELLVDQLGDAWRDVVVASPAADTALRALESAQLVVDTDDLTRQRRLLGRARVDPAYAQHGPDAVRRLAARAAAVVSITDTAGSALDVTPLRDLLATSGVRVRAGGDVAPDAPTVHVLASAGPVARSRIDEWVREGAPHLLLAGHEGRLRVGPFVSPGVTACLRCIDAHESERDPRRPLLVEQLSAGAADEPVDPVLAALALAWAARDLLGFVDGDRPSTWSATVDVDGAGPPRVRSWDRHPDCGCAWDALPY